MLITRQETDRIQCKLLYTWFEVTHLGGRTLIFGGDLDLVAFAYFTTRPWSLEAMVRWIGYGERDYIARKAVIGFDGNRTLVYDYDHEYAKRQVAQFAREGLITETLWAEVNDTTTRQELCSVLSSDSNMVEHVPRIGEVIAPRVAIAHRALGQLAQFFDASR